MKKLFYFPAKNLALVIPIVLAVGFLVGYYNDTGFLKGIILPMTFFMIYPTMIGFKIKEAYNLSHIRPLIFSLIINFMIIPILAYVLGITMLSDQPEMMAGLAMASLLPTSGMTISWTMIFKGNVPAAVKMTAIGLITGSLLAPWYLLLMVGKLVDINVGQMFTTISVVVFLPLILGNLTHKAILKKYDAKEFQTKIKPILPAWSTWAMLVIIFSSISMKAKMIVSQPDLIIKGLAVLAVFYVVNFTLSTMTAKMFLNKGDGIALVYGTVMRNLSISLGVALASFGIKAGLIVTLAFILQVQGAAWYGKIAEKFGFFDNSRLELAQNK